MYFLDMKSRGFKRFMKSINLFIYKIRGLVTQPIFIVLTIFGNLLVTVASSLLYHYEFGLNPQINSKLDTVWWAVSTVTTVGYGDIIPVTPEGKVVGIFLMIIGIAIFWSYTALFAEALISKDILDLEDGLKSIDRILKRISKSELENEELKELIELMQKQLQLIKK